MLEADTLNYFYPVGAISVNQKTKTMIVHRKNLLPQKLPQSSSNKKNIYSLSRSSLNRLTFLIQNTPTQFKSLLTLTFLCPPLAERAKECLNKFLIFLGRQCKTKLKYLWFMEFSRQGSIHFHILLELAWDKRLHISLARFWAILTEPLNVSYSNRKTKRELMTQEAVLAVHSHKKAWENIRKKDGSKRYVTKYASKPYQKIAPSWMRMTGRFWGNDRQTGKVDWSQWESCQATEREVRDYLRVDDHRVGKWEILPKYVFGVTLPE